jgi:hypothetical protein
MDGKEDCRRDEVTTFRLPDAVRRRGVVRGMRWRFMSGGRRDEMVLGLGLDREIGGDHRP